MESLEWEKGQRNRGTRTSRT